MSSDNSNQDRVGPSQSHIQHQSSLNLNSDEYQSPRSQSGPTLASNINNDSDELNQPPLPPHAFSPQGEYSPTSPHPSTMPRAPSPLVPDSSSSTSSNEDTRADNSQPQFGLGVPQRPSLGSTPSTEPLVPPEESPLSGPTVNPFSRNLQAEPSAYTPSSLGRPSTSGSTHSGLSPAAPKIRINDMPNSPPSEDVSQVPTPSAPEPFNSPFSKPISQKRGSLASVPPSPTNVAFKRSSTPISSAGTGAVHTATGVEVNATKGNIAARRALRMKQAQSTDSKGNRYSNYAAPNKNSALNRKAFQSTRLKGEIYKPWLEQKDPALRWARWITIVSIILGFAIAGVICYDGYASVPKLGKVCSVLNDDFSSGTIDPNIWQREVRLDGYGYGSFQWTTNDDENAYVKDGTLYIVPTLTSDKIGNDAITNGYTVNLTADGSCTSNNVSQCVAVSNSSLLTVINPVRSARLITKNTVNIKYGKVEVKARFPAGDWLWPRISLLPANNTYGAYPRSGQINILNGKGNNASYTQRGVDFAQSDLHWGPTVDLDRQYLTWGYREQRRTYYSQKFHTFGLEWNDKFMWTYIDSRVAQVVSYRFNKESFWTRGKFPATYTNNTEVIKLTNPWLSSDENVAPFDQPFYLMIDLAVGSQDGWFPDGEGGKPWIDQSGSAMSDFWLAKSRWWDSSWSSDPTVRGFAIDSVKMWNKC
ncbi:hypothetical protein I317_01835 [Kwoniella heveanensis CBS 569]|uniref:GH16 domain-containing protein n=1 Tax=Kwoniella heveanensis BCC8398 TaxID=1296120 RepID=A0A1B9GVR5_9TREE|nr:hypothetical protein I316_03164 [Kwoniella heveanensis BCC8398]OCF44389.1 hypothetical protein I317_01835 [Kwoniella heveanensis CBS 569]